MAVNKPSYQISTWDHGPHLVNDGNNNQDHFASACSHTYASPAPWWKVDLQNMYVIRSVKIYNRADSNTDRLQNGQIKVADNLNFDMVDFKACGEFQTMTEPTSREFFCPGYTYGQFVEVIMFHNEILTLCEVEVYGYLLNE